ncbi:Tellurium resistance protein terZ [Moraxella osloensis]|jgi:tellurium resistance protein TerZ|uniref:TerD family protein n=3 Tax=Pseudomonadota TaxID=1224 RepID=A0AAW6TDG9_FAUOS|nr:MULTISPECIES: TerD family protein [Pseudomonadota]EEV23285.1 bacterial stress protein [Enhydrobacter aerosaccus SK60]HCN14549.1 TerD family protein [Moraxellaceae bacterium]ATQ84593.1 Tellurium resistance protein terZ [Moraxella osloensis]KND21514.1 Tellurium resistance protein terZ [Enhydrobacter aerosaccus]MBW4016177.1 TerD family protein [Moraxella osloensis]
MAVNLSKGQKISLEKEAGGALSQIKMGLGWDVGAAPQKSGGFLGGLFGGGGSAGGSIDLDASCIMLDANKQMVDAIWFGQLQSKDSSIQHTGDNRTGAGDGDDEVINVNLSRIPDHVQALVFTVNSFTGQTFATVNNAFCRLVNASNNSEVARYDLSAQGSHTALILAKIYRHNGEWKMHAIGETASGRTFHDLMPAILPHV